MTLTLRVVNFVQSDCSWSHSSRELNPNLPFLGSIREPSSEGGCSAPQNQILTAPSSKKSLENTNFINLLELIVVAIRKIYHNLLITVNYRMCEYFSSTIALCIWSKIFTQVGRNQSASEINTIQLII